MALYQPTQIVPSTLSGLGDGVIDATEDLVVSWQINGFSAMNAYKIVIYQNDSVSTQMLDTGKVTLLDPVYGTDQNGNQILFNANTISAASLSSAGIVNGYANGYKLIITQYWGVSDSITQTSASVFLTRANPTVTMGAISNPLASKELSVSATYSQAQGDSLSWVRWILTDYSGNVLKDTGRVSTGVLQFDYDGLFSGDSYYVECIVETENGVTATTGKVNFDVSYTMAPSEGLVDLCRRAGQPYVEVSWSDRSAIEGEATGTYTISGGLLRLPSGSSVTWDNVDGIPISFVKPWSMAWRGQIPNPDNTGFDAVEMDLDNSHKIVVNVKDTVVSVKFDGVAIMSQALTMKKNDTLVLAITPTEWYLKQVTYTGGLLPATDLYPSSTLYPDPVTKQINTWNGTLTYTQEDVTGLTLNGEQTCEYLWLYRDEFPQDIIDNLMGGEWYEPSFDAMTLFLATFEEANLYAYVSEGAGETIYGMTIYRREGADPTLARIADIEPGYTIFRDYSCKSNTPYTYYLYLKGQDTYISAPYESATIRPGFNFYTLMECRKDSSEPNIYHVLQAFLVSGNLNAGAVSNNNNPNILENFTRFPLRQAAPQNYKSGVLTTLIGEVDYGHNVYEDSWDLADRISALSLSQNTLFLKDMKGGLWMIHTNGPISMAVDDKNYVQPIQMSFPWVEIGSADGVSIVTLPTDALWETDEVIDTTLSVDTDTGILSWTRPDVYRGSSFVMNDAGHLIAQGIGTVEMANMHIDENENLIATL